MSVLLGISLLAGQMSYIYCYILYWVYNLGCQHSGLRWGREAGGLTVWFVSLLLPVSGGGDSCLGLRFALTGLLCRVREEICISLTTCCRLPICRILAPFLLHSKRYLMWQNPVHFVFWWQVGHFLDLAASLGFCFPWAAKSMTT